MDLNIEKIGAELHKFLTTKTVVGDPIVVGKVSLVPIQRASFGFGTGGGEGGKDSSSGGGSGAGVNLQPIAIVAIKEDGQVQVYSMGRKGTWEQLIEMLPEMISKVDLDRFMEKFRRGKTQDEEEIE